MQPGMYPPQQPRKSRTWLIVVGILGAIVVACCGIGGVIVASSGGDENSGPASTVTSPTANTAVLNTPVRDGKFEFVVSAVECGKRVVGSEFSEEQAQGQFCVVSLSVKNIGPSPQYFSDTEQKGFAPNGAQYAPDFSATLSVNDQPVFGQINPGNMISGKIVFDIPADAKLVKLELHDSMFSGGATVTVG